MAEEVRFLPQESKSFPETRHLKQVLKQLTSYQISSKSLSTKLFCVVDVFSGNMIARLIIS
jgi:hypothetical protein